MDALTPWHLLLILLAFVLLFGYKKLPDATRSLGRSVRIFTSEMRGTSTDEASGDRHPPDGPLALSGGESAQELEEQARAAEAVAALLRARASASAAGQGAAS